MADLKSSVTSGARALVISLLLVNVLDVADHDVLPSEPPFTEWALVEDVGVFEFDMACLKFKLKNIFSSFK